jgi:hypothetical protein
LGLARKGAHYANRVEHQAEMREGDGNYDEEWKEEPYGEYANQAYKEKGKRKGFGERHSTPNATGVGVLDTAEKNAALRKPTGEAT